METVPHPPIVDRDSWTTARKSLLTREKALLEQMDEVNAARRRLPMVKLDKHYEFDGPQGRVSLLDLFAGRRQLIVYHFMFDPAWEKGCPGCTMMVDSLGDLSMLEKRDTTYVLISRAPLAKLQAYKAERGWDRTWVSSFDSTFNYDFHVTLDRDIVPLEYNYRDLEKQPKANDPNVQAGESHGLSVFFRIDDDVYHTYSTYARGCESVNDAYALLDRTPYGRQEDFEDSPEGWPQKPTYG